MRLKAAIIGAGLMGKWHAHSIRRIGAEVSTIIDSNAEAGRELASRCGAQYFSEPGVIFDAGSCDIVHICTPRASHFSLAINALDAGKHVLVEKPLTQTENEATQLSHRSAETGKLVCPVYQLPFQRGVKSLQQKLAQRSAPPLGIEFNIASAGGAGLPDSSLNSMILEILPHPLSVLYQLWPIEKQSEADWIITWPVRGELIAQGVHSDITVSIRISLHARPTCCNMVIRHSLGAIEQDFFHGYAVFDSARTSRFSKATAPFQHSTKVMTAATSNLFIRALDRQWAYPGLEALLRKFYAAVSSGDDQAPITVRDYISIARICDHFGSQLPNA